MQSILILGREIFIYVFLFYLMLSEAELLCVG